MTAPQEREAVAIAQALQTGVGHHQAGRLAEAERAYQQALQVDPNNPVALHLLGIVAHQAGKNEASVELIDRALAVKPDFDEALYNRGLVLQELRRPEEALASYDRALAVRPDFAEAQFNRGNVLLELGRSAEALASYDRVLAIMPGFAEALINRGNALRKLKRAGEALASYDRALAIRPDHAGAWSNRGNALLELKRVEEALASCERALAIGPDYTDALNNRGLALYELKRCEEALASYDRALAVRPDYAEAWSNRGNVLKELNRYDDALVSHERSLAIRPDVPEFLSNRGIALHELARYEEALASYDRALAINPDYADAWRYRGTALQRLKRNDEALASYDRAQAVNPDHAEAHWNEGLCRLLIGDLGRGWEKYEWRWKCAEFMSSQRDFAQPLWLGKEDIAGRTILLHAEQGLGDTIQFVRYTPLVAQLGATVILEVQPTLRPLLSDIPAARQVLSRGEPLPEFDFHCPLLSLPLAFNTRLETIPAAVPYLHTAQAAKEKWKGKLGPGNVPQVGIAWSGRLSQKFDLRNRSIGLSRLVALASHGAQLVSLHNVVRPEDQLVLEANEQILHFGRDLDDFSDMAALVSLLDLVISVDTSVAHLAGALGKPVWVLLPFDPEWRWLTGRDDSPWYPSARLFRQPKAGDWDSVISDVARDLGAIGARK